MFSLNPQLSWFSRLTACLAVALVLLLDVLATSPVLHARLHGQEQAPEHGGHGHEPVVDPDHECAVTIFSHGATALLVFRLQMLLCPSGRRIARHAKERMSGDRPRYWHAPAQAPPLG